MWPFEPPDQPTEADLGKEKTCKGRTESISIIKMTHLLQSEMSFSSQQAHARAVKILHFQMNVTPKSYPNY